jgi:hypothetical protein
MRRRRRPVTRTVPLSEYERRHFAILIESMSRQGRSEREIAAAVEQAIAPKQSRRSGRPE